MRKIRRQIKRFAKIVVGKEKYWKIQCRIAKERFGSDFAGWDVATEGISDTSIVYSFGVGEDVSFDLALIKRFGLTIHAYDPTPKSIDWVHKQNLPKSFVLHEYGLADFDGDMPFNPPENPDHVSYSLLERSSTHNDTITLPVKKLATITEGLGHTQIDILKMDIEGAEYKVIQDLVQSKIRPAQILVEFHHRFSNVGLEQTEAAITQLNSIGYCLFSVSASGEEFSLYYNVK